MNYQRNCLIGESWKITIVTVDNLLQNIETVNALAVGTDRDFLLTYLTATGKLFHTTLALRR
eukprot:TRINITY_DN15520_c0_g1_i1.p1 TRINITY_DN15520_c0_g1~~TRINITY_DN15520_c0_g1_i1.p1  ORF type:complete len:62 (+),score=4.20 TRINITY_DN15520_c0_g1_i1:274-459(+)